MKTSVSRWVLCAAIAIGLALRAFGQTQPGQIQAASVEGQVLKLVNSAPAVTVKDGDQLTESDTITTGANSGVVLVFMNGSSVKLGANSRLAIDEFKMDPLAEDVKMADFKDRKKGEPSVSKTNLNLVYGDMVGDVRHLNKSSSYSIKTPAGAAGIRGTIFRIVFRPDANGKAFFTVSTAEGLVVMQGVTAVEIPIPVGKEVVATVDIPEASPVPAATPAAPVAAPAEGTAAPAAPAAAPAATPAESAAPAAATPAATKPAATPSVPVIVTQDIPATTQAIIVTATTNIATVLQQTIFTPNTKAVDDKASADKKAADEKAAADKKAADDKAAADKKAADDKATADQKAADDKAAADTKAATVEKAAVAPEVVAPAATPAVTPVATPVVTPVATPTPAPLPKPTPPPVFVPVPT
ncbi:MAG: FecR family protein, partial [Opitutaceae bacterium]